MVRNNLNYMQKFYFSIILKCSLVIGLIIITAGCRTIFEKKLDGEEVEMIIPVNADTLYTNEVHFKWEAMEGAKYYHLQVVSPAFDDITTFNIDSTIHDTEARFVLAPGDYQFRIRGENSAYVSDYIDPVNIYIDSVNDLSEQVVQLLTPLDNIYTNETKFNNFSWENLFSADYYTFQIRKGSGFEAGSLIHEEPILYSINYSLYQSSGTELNEGYIFGE